MKKSALNMLGVSSPMNQNNGKEEIKTWQSKRINAINRKIKNCANKQAMTENYIDEHWRICNSQARDKEEYKAQCEHEYNDYVNACLE